MSLKSSQRTMLLAIALLLFIPIVFLQRSIDPQRAQYLPGNVRYGNKGLDRLPIQFALGGLIGFREAIAGLLWVRCDEFFDKGEYESVIPMIRIITWLDPHQTDVYETGAWHMDYNITDIDQLSDRRFIPLSLALMREGIQNNNMNPGMYADMAFTQYFRKIADFPMALKYYVAGQNVDNQIRVETENDLKDSNAHAQAKKAAHSVTTIGHMMAHTYEALGEIPQAIQEWKLCIALHQWDLAHHINGKYPEQAGLTTSENNLREDTYRMKWRAIEDKKPLNMEFHPILVRVAPKIFVLKGSMHVIGATSFHLRTDQVTWGPVNGCRVEIRLNNKGYKMPYIPSLTLGNLGLPHNLTIMQDAASVTGGLIGGQIGRKIDMSQNPSMYSFTAPEYTVTIWFQPSNPNDCPINVQDRIGWLGQAITDSDPRVIDTSGLVPGDTAGIPIQGLKMLVKKFTLTRADILGKGEKVWQ